MSTDNGDIRRRLENLGSALGDTQLPGPDAARRRAQQRSRRQAGGAVLGAVAAVAVGAIAIGGLPTMNTAPPDPAKSPTGHPTVAPPDDGLVLTVDDLEAISGADELVGWTETESRPEPSFECAPTIGDAEHVVQRSFVTPDEGRLDQIVEISTPDRAQARIDAVTDGIRTCVEEAEAANPDDYRLDEIWTIDGVGDAAWIARYWSPPRVDDGATLVVVSVALVGDTVTTVAQGGWAMDANLPPSDDLARLATERLCEASGRTCGSEPDGHRLYPDPSPELSGWLTVADVVQASGLDDITEAGEVVDGEGTYGFACIEVDAAADGASSVERRSYHDPFFESDAILDQATAVFPSAEAAEAHFDRVAAEAGECAGGSPTEETGQVTGPGFRGSSWRSTDEEFGTAFVFGAVVNGPAVSVLTFAVPSGESPDLDPDQIGALLTRAGERLAELE